jgi:hypothetical protein
MLADGEHFPPSAVGAPDLYPTATDLGVRGSTPLERANLFKNLET